MTKPPKKAAWPRAAGNRWLRHNRPISARSVHPEPTALSDIFKNLTSTLTSQLTNPHGFDQATLAALRGGATDTISKQFQFSQQAAQTGLAGNGSFGSDVRSGVMSQVLGGLAGQQAGAEAGALDQIEQQNAELKQSNYWKAIAGLSDGAQIENPQSYAGQATGAAGEVGDLGSRYFQTDNRGFLDKLGG